ncbi:MAG: extracellular solute-binding protein [Gemmatimonadota bacterium]
MTARRATRSLPARLVIAVACAASGPASACGGGAGHVEVLYAGSLTRTMEQGLGPAFGDASGLLFRGEPRGSVAGANLVRDGVRRPDLYVTADPATFHVLGPSWAGWGVVFAAGELVIGYESSGRFGAALDSAAAGAADWTDVLTRPGFRFGRTEPDRDPKGYRTLWMLELAEAWLERPGLKRRILSAGTGLVYPEEHLAARVQTGELDAGAFSLAEARALGLSVVRLPPEVNQGRVEEAARYATRAYRTKGGAEFRGAPILFSATIPAGAPHPKAGEAFLRYLLGDAARARLQAAGFQPLRYRVGPSAAFPASLADLSELPPAPDVAVAARSDAGY